MKSEKNDKTQPAADSAGRHSPLVGQVVLLVGFALVAVASIFTVLVPELEDGEDEQLEESAPAPSVQDQPSANVDAPGRLAP